MSGIGATSLEAVIPDATLYAGEDRIAPAVDDATEPTAGAIIRESAPVEATPPEEPAEPKQIVDPREAIAARSAARRAKDHAAAENIDPDSAPIQAHAPGQDDPTAAAIVEQTRSQHPTIRPDAAKPYELKVNRSAFQASRSELLAACEMDEGDADGIPDHTLVKIAQKNIAAQMRLDEAKSLSRNGDTTPYAQPQQDYQPAPVPAQPADDDADLIQKIQLGDTTEAQQAFNEMFARRQRADREQQTRASMQNEVGQAVETFGRVNPDIANDAIAADLLRTLSVREAVSELQQKVGLSEQDCAKLLNNPEMAVQAYTGARIKGYQVRSPAELFASAGQTVRARLNMTAPVDNSAAQNLTNAPDRLAMKRALPQSPARSGAANLSSPAAKPQADVRNPSAIIEQMKRARFQS